MIYAYAVIAAALVPILDKYFPILRESYSLWLVPVLFVGFFLGFIILHLLFAITVYSLVDLNKPVKNYKFYRFVAKNTLPLILSVLRVKVVATGDDILPENQRFVLMSNHTHLFDPLIFLGKYPEAELSFIGKKEITEKMKIVAKFIWSIKGMFVDRENLRSGAKVIINSVKQLKDDETSICIFPEGTRSKDGNVGELKPGGFKMAKKADVPAVICTLNGVTEVFHNFPLLPTTVNLDFLKVYTPADYEDLTEQELLEQTRNLMTENLSKYKKEG